MKKDPWFNPQKLGCLQSLLALLGLFAMTAVIGWCGHGISSSQPTAASPRTPTRIAEDEEKAAAKLVADGAARVEAREAAHQSPTVDDHKWYDGGTLARSNGLDWQKADHANRLATAADILAKFWTDGSLKPIVAAKLHSVDDLRGPSEELVTALDAAFVKAPTPRENVKRLRNQPVSDTAVVVLMLMGWL